MILLILLSALSIASIISWAGTATRYEITDEAISRVVTTINSGDTPSERYMYLCSNRKADPLIFMVDDGARTTHIEFQSRASCLKGIPNFDGDHGTAVGSRIIGNSLGFARNSNMTILPVRSPSGLFWRNASFVKEYIKDVRKSTNRPIILNLSFQILENSCSDVQELLNLGVSIITSAGNDGTQSDTLLKCQIDDIIVVGATEYQSDFDIPELLAEFSNYGNSVTVFAPGHDISLASYLSDTEYFIGSGTSFSAPLVAGLAAVLLEQKPDATPKEVKEQLIRMSVTGIIDFMPDDSTNRLLKVDLSSKEAACNLWEQEGGVYSPI